MKLTYNIALPIVHILAVLALVTMGFARMMAWLCWSWVNDLLYILAAAAVLSGHWLLLYFGRKRELIVGGVIRLMGTVDYILFSLQLALVVAWLVWEAAFPLLNDTKTFSLLVPVALLPVAAVDICAMVLRMKTTQQLQLPE